MAEKQPLHSSDIIYPPGSLQPEASISLRLLWCRLDDSAGWPNHFEPFIPSPAVILERWNITLRNARCEVRAQPVDGDRAPREVMPGSSLSGHCSGELSAALHTSSIDDVVNGDFAIDGQHDVDCPVEGSIAEPRTFDGTSVDLTDSANRAGFTKGTAIAFKWRGRAGAIFRDITYFNEQFNIGEKANCCNYSFGKKSPFRSHFMSLQFSS